MDDSLEYHSLDHGLYMYGALEVGYGGNELVEILQCRSEVLKPKICHLCETEDFYWGMKDFAHDADHVCYRDHSRKVICEDVAQVNTKSICGDDDVLTSMNVLESDNVVETAKVFESEESRGHEEEQLSSVEAWPCIVADVQLAEVEPHRIASACYFCDFDFDDCLDFHPELSWEL